ncbi:hematopoietic prostaglandin D synthase-like [Amphiura filiformis]|uniref:hematopoietic prostaglandin D synthase-like n=1 Tax=Amphiura filiformis TaxID=82378 RepID=UPI003B215A6C
MPSYKLTYFNGRGRGENARMMFAAAGVPYEDNRIEFKDWPQMKASTPLGSLPILEVDGKQKLVESKAINRYMAREFGFYGKDNMESTRIDIVTEIIDDIWLKLVDAMFENDEAKKEEQLNKIFTETAPKKLEFLEQFLGENDEGKSYFVGKSITFADIDFIHAMSYYLLPGKNDNGLDKYPKLKALLERASAHEKIAAWIAERPVTPF